MGVTVGERATTNAAVGVCVGAGAVVSDAEFKIPLITSDTCERTSGFWYAYSPMTPIIMPMTSGFSVFPIDYTQLQTRTNSCGQNHLPDFILHIL